MTDNYNEKFESLEEIIGLQNNLLVSKELWSNLVKIQNYLTKEFEGQKLEKLLKLFEEMKQEILVAKTIFLTGEVEEQFKRIKKYSSLFIF